MTSRTWSALGDCFHLHPLVLEDILNTDQRPKLDDYDDYLFIILKMLHPRRGRPTTVITEQISIIVGDNYVISLQEDDQDDLRHHPGAAQGRQGPHPQGEAPITWPMPS